MADPIEANYILDGDDWTITIIGRGRTLTAKAPGIIAARDRTDQLVEELTPDEEHRTVVHLLDGDAVEFTTAYLTARMAKTEPAPESESPASPDAAPADHAVPAASPDGAAPEDPPEDATPSDPLESATPAELSPAARKTPSPRPREGSANGTAPEAEPAPDEVPTLS